MVSHDATMKYKQKDSLQAKSTAGGKQVWAGETRLLLCG